MRPLQDWIVVLVRRSVSDLNDRYATEESVRHEIDSLPLPTDKRGYTVESSHVSEQVLQQLHRKIRNIPCERAIWNAVIWYLADPLPLSVAHDLIDRLISTNAMSMTRQVDEAQWRLATLYEDALYTLIRERYVEPRYSISQFEKILEAYQRSFYYSGILYMLSFYETPSPEKQAIFEKAVVQEKEHLEEVD